MKIKYLPTPPCRSGLLLHLGGLLDGEEAINRDVRWKRVGNELYVQQLDGEWKISLPFYVQHKDLVANPSDFYPCTTNFNYITVKII